MIITDPNIHSALILSKFHDALRDCEHLSREALESVERDAMSEWRKLSLFEPGSSEALERYLYLGLADWARFQIDRRRRVSKATEPCHQCGQPQVARCGYCDAPLCSDCDGHCEHCSELVEATAGQERVGPLEAMRRQWVEDSKRDD